MVAGNGTWNIRKSISFPIFHIDCHFREQKLFSTLNADRLWTLITSKIWPTDFVLRGQATVTVVLIWWKIVFYFEVDSPSNNISNDSSLQSMMMVLMTMMTTARQANGRDIALHAGIQNSATSLNVANLLTIHLTVVNLTTNTSPPNENAYLNDDNRWLLFILWFRDR